MAQNQVGFDILLAGDVDGARRALAAAADVHRRLMNFEGLSYWLDGMASVALFQRRAEAAGRLVGAAAELRRVIGVVVWPLMRPLADRLDQALRAALPPPAFDRALAAGAALRPLDALDYALEATG